MRSTGSAYGFNALRLTVITALVAGVLFAFPAASAAAACVVGPGPHPTIQAAISDANCDEITVPAGTYYENLTIVFRDIVITGAGNDATIIHGSGEGSVITAVWATATLNGLTVTNGHATDLTGGSGGGIYSSRASVILVDSTVTGNLAPNVGGGIYADFGTLWLINSTVSGNTAVDGGGIFGYVEATTLINSTVSANTANGIFAVGGGILANRESLTLVNSTVSGNRSERFAGGIQAQSASLSLTTSTVTGNVAVVAGGIRSVLSSARVGQSIVAGNVAPASPHQDVQSFPFAVESTGYNVFGRIDLWTPGPGDLSFVSAPLVWPLADNGGPTLTHALRPGSPAIDIVPVGACGGTDQRGVPRPQGIGCDAGAFEKVVPLARDDAYSIPEDERLWVSAPGVLSNDSHRDGDTLTVSSMVNPPVHGVIEYYRADGGFRYVPNPDFHGTDHFDYEVTDEHGGIDQARVTITVVSVNDPPVAHDQSVSTPEDTPIDIQLTGSDVDGTIVFMSIVDGPSHGTLDAGSVPLPVTYTPDPNWYGTDTITFTVGDDEGATSEVATVTVEVTSVNDPPVADANGPYTGNEGSPVTLDASGSWDADDDPLGTDVTTYAWDVDNDGIYDLTGVQVQYVFGDQGFYPVALQVTDSHESADVDTSTVTVSNVAPTVDAPTVAPAPFVEGVAATASATFADPGFADGPFTCKVEYGDGSALQPATVDGNTCTGSLHTYADDETYVIRVTVTDKDGGSGSNTVSHQVANVAPDVSVNSASQAVQYSDALTEVTITAVDLSTDPLSLSTQWRVDGGAFAPGLPASLATTDIGCTTSGGFDTCTWTLSGIVGVPAGVYTVRLSIDDGDGGVTVSDITITVSPENASVAFFDDNPIRVKVAAPGGTSEPFDLAVEITETVPDTPAALAAAGDISLAGVSISLVPIGPGGSASPSGACTEVTTGSDYSGVLTVTCPFDAVAVNTYAVDVTADGSYYTGGNEEMLVVYDQSLGFTTGGGWFYWPGTDDKTNFGYVVKYNKKGTKVQGSFLLIRHLDDDSKYRVKSNALYGLALGEDTATGWASFSGKATYLEPGGDAAIGNHEFVVYVEDHGEPGGGGDRLWLETYDRSGDVITALSMDRDASSNATTLTGGNIVVPH